MTHPTVFFSTEPAIGMMTTLKYLNLGNNLLNGLPPSNAALLPSMNDITTPLTNCRSTLGFANLTKLKQLNLRHNKISVLGGEIGKLTRLEELILYGNPLVLIAPEVLPQKSLSIQAVD